jgi:hypothetical protein
MKYLLLLKKWVLRLAVIFVLVWVFIFNWSFVFKRRVIGEVVAAEKVMSPMAIVTGNQPLNSQIFSFSVGIKDRSSGEIFMASSEDRQWAAVAKGNCVVAAYFPYPPWRFDKGSTNHNARLLRNFTDCQNMPDQSGWFESVKFFFLID